MKTLYLAITYIVLIIAWLLLCILSELDSTILILILINIIIIISRAPLIQFSRTLFRRRFIRVLFATIINIVWSIFLLWLLFHLSPDTFIAIVSFLVIAIALTFKKIINNFAAGALMLTSEQFEVGDLVETNGIQGLVEEITLNYMVIRELDGTKVIIPNSNVYGSMLIKFTHRRFIEIPPPKPGASEKKKQRYLKYLQYMNKLLTTQPKLTKYVKQLEILEKVDPEQLDDKLNPVFTKYQEIFGMRPDYVVDTLRYGRCRINLYVLSKRPELVVNNLDAFLRDLLFALYHDDIYKGWKDYKKNMNIPIKKGGSK